MKKTMLIGIDGAIPTMIEKFTKSGDMPNLSHLMKAGAYSRMLSQIPVATPINWASITTGSPPGGHNVTGFWCHNPGDRIDAFQSDRAFDNRFVKAERLWQAAARAGKRSVILKFPGSWPSSVENGVVVDGNCIPGHGSSVLELAANGCHSVKPLKKAAAIRLAEASGWKNLPAGTCREAEITIPLKQGYEPIRYYLLAFGEDGLSRVLLCREKDAAEAFADMRPGDWSPWVWEKVAEDKTATVRFKLSELSADGSALRLYHTQIYPTNGFTAPDEVGPMLIEKLGPFVEFATPHAWKFGWVDLETCYEEAEEQIRWLSGAADILLSEPWDLFITQMHWIDHVQHYFLPFVDPVSPVFRPESAAESWEIMRRAYALADRFIGALAKTGGEDAALFILSDHGNICDEYTVALLPWFRDNGLVALSEDKNGALHIDWSRTVAYPCKPGNCDVYINVKGRDKEGCVPPEKYEEVRTDIMRRLSAFTDQKGDPVFSLVLKREDAAQYGLFGKYLGDIIAVYRPGASWSGHGGEEWDRTEGIFELPDPDGSDYCAHHGPTLPTASTQVSTNLAFLVVAGAGARRDYHRDEQEQGLVSVLDIAPTISEVAGFPTPEHSRGAVLFDMLCTS